MLLSGTTFIHLAVCLVMCIALGVSITPDVVESLLVRVSDDTATDRL